MATPRPRRVFAASLPIAGISLFWLVVSWLGSRPILGTGARIAGLVMALAYAVARGVALADRTPPAFSSGDIGAVLGANGRALLASAGWFGLARLVVFAEQLWDELALPGAFTSPADGLAFAFTATGVATVLMYAVALVARGLRDGSPRGSGAG